MDIFSNRAIFFCIVVICILFMPVIASAQEVIDETSIVLDQTDVQSDTVVEQNRSPSLLAVLVKIIFALILVCGAIYGAVFLIRKATRTNVADNPYLKQLARLPLSQNKSIELVSMGSRAFMLGVTEQAIQLIAEVEDREMIDEMILAAEKNSPLPAANFASILSSFFPSTGKHNANSLSPGVDIIRKQRERLGRTANKSGSTDSGGST